MANIIFTKSLWASVRTLLGCDGNAISSEEALKIAEKAAIDRGYPWLGDSYVREGSKEFWVCSNHSDHGMNVSASIGKHSGRVLEIKYYNR